MFLVLNKDETPLSQPRAPWSGREPIDLGEVLVEFFAVVRGGLIALTINGWHAAAQQQA